MYISLEPKKDYFGDLDNLSVRIEKTSGGSYIFEMGQYDPKIKKFLLRVSLGAETSFR
jgi:hypothetical protein